MRIAFLSVIRHPSMHYIGGGDVRQWQDFQALRALGHEIHAVTVDPNAAISPELEQGARSVTEIHSEKSSPLRAAYWKRRFFNQESLYLLDPDIAGARSNVQRALDRIQPDLIWAETTFALALVPSGFPCVHSHLDFMHKLRPVRNSFSSVVRKPDLVSLSKFRDAELELCKQARETICASYTEKQLLEQHGISARYLPVSVADLPRPDFSKLPREPRLVLLGNPNTAMRAARIHLRQEIWPIVEKRGLKADWHQVGVVPRPGQDPSWEWLEQRFKIHGYVDDLATVLRPGDASIMPYPYDTGGRAKFGVAAGYGLVNIAYQITFACANEFVPGKDCVMATDPASFVDALSEYVSNFEWRKRLAENSRACFEKNHRLEAQLPIYQDVLNAAMKQINL